MNETDYSHHLRELEAFFANPDIRRDSFRMLIHFSIRLAGVGHTSDVLTIVERSPDIALFQPLADGLRLHSGLPLQSEGHSRKLALQIASKIAAEVAAHPRDVRAIA